jgi:histidinol-phosphate aminotransferase
VTTYRMECWEMRKKVKKQMEPLKSYQPGKTMEEVKRELGLSDVIKLASNENPHGCSSSVEHAIGNSFQKLAQYPDGYAKDLRVGLSSFLQVNEEQLIFGNGTDEIVTMISRTFLGEGVNTVMATPTFPQYKHNAIIEGAEIREIPLKDGYHNLEEMYDNVDENTAVIWICSPNNPSGTYSSEDELHNFVKKIPDDVLIVLDEAYYEYVVASDYPETISWLEDFPNLIILRTFSKAYGLASFRVGYGISNPIIISQLSPARNPFNTSRFAHVAAIAALEDQQFITYTKKKNKEGLKKFYQFCNEFDLYYYPSEANFILIDFGIPGDEVFQHLLRNGFIVRSGELLGFPTSVRITIGTEEQNEGIINVLSDWLIQNKQKRA